MKIVHRVGLGMDLAKRKALEALRVRLPREISMPGGGYPFIYFDIDESHPSWTRVRDLIERWGASDVLRTEFSADEINNAHWLEITAQHRGFPQPDPDSFGYLKATYDLTDWCNLCGIGKVQNAPFRIEGEPNWARVGVFQLVWVYDELFVSKKVWESIFRPLGIPGRLVCDKEGNELQTVVQLDIEDSVDIDVSGIELSKCEKCGRAKYLPIARGMFPALTNQPSRDLVRTRVNFGSGGQASMRIIGSQALWMTLVREHMRGLSVRPVRT